ncbi:hypothetical protein [Oricola cellulosilytica]|uniref:GNAT family N-acetyltransferase n=1 Tax=Oricola cellulosilytica TaxID=1429082 RepID=A0A4R0PCF4_9HYPH|nr:hypothetical protein [Oricola cellulosilytica]TCD15152.1 hypothetical protein E0D97_06280 [Oricola cellulosilytica]
MIEWRPAAIGDLAAVRPHCGARRFNLLCRQISDFPAWTVCLDGKPVAVCGLAPAGPDTYEAWLTVSADLRGRAGVTVIRAILMRTAEIMPWDHLICRIRDGHAAGRRMATLVGFQPTAETLRSTDIRTWHRPPLFGETQKVTAECRP